jgi:hypothetical protein
MTLKVKISSVLMHLFSLAGHLSCRYKKSAFIGMSILIAACSTIPVENDTPAQCFLNETMQPVTKICRVFSLTDWETLGLKAQDPVSNKVLESISRSVEGDEVSANFYPTFVKNPTRDLPLAIVDTEGWTLEALLKSSADKSSCSYVRDAEALFKEYGGDNQVTPEDEKQGNRCGNISIIHSLVRLGVLTEAQAYSGEFLNPDMVSRLDQFHGDDPGMTADQQKRAYEDFSTADREIKCNVTSSGDVTNKGEVERVAMTLSSKMQSEKPKYDCSLAIHADDQPGGASGFKHVEHVTGVRLSPSGEYLIDTLDGFQQGEGGTKIPKTPATNTWGVGSGTFGSDWVQLKDSSSQDNKRRFSKIPPNWIEMRCCEASTTAGE